METKCDSGARVSSKRLLRFASLLIVFAMVTPVLMASADIAWQTMLQVPPCTETVLQQPLSTRAVDSTTPQHAELAFSATETYVSNPVVGDATRNYWQVTVATTASADVLGTLGYSIQSIGTDPALWDGVSLSERTYLSLANDGGKWVNLPAGWFCVYYGKYYNSIYVCANGFVILGADPTLVKDTAVKTAYTAPPTSTTFPNSANPNGVIAPLWRDLNPDPNYGGGGSVYCGPCDWNGGGTHDRLFAVIWENVPNAGGTKAKQYFGLWLEIANDERFTNPTWAFGIMRFRYSEITKDNRVTTAVGFEDQFGKRGSPTTLSITSVGTGKWANIKPWTDNFYSISDVKVYAEARDELGRVDPYVCIDFWGQNDANPGMVNLAPSPTSGSYTDPNLLYTAKTADYLIGFIPIVGTVYSSLCYAQDINSLIKDYRSAYAAPESHNPTAKGDPEACRFYGATKNYQNPLGLTKDIWVAPVFRWYIYNDPGVQNHDHTLNMWAEITVSTSNFQSYTLATGSMSFTLKGAIFTENFDDGTLDPWISQKTGSTSIVEVTNAKPYNGGYSLHAKTFGSYTARVNSPALSNWDTTSPYELNFYYFASISKYAVVVDDGRLEVIEQTGVLSAVTPSGKVVIGSVSTGAWHHIIIRATPASSNFVIFVDAAGFGPSALKNPSSASKVISFGSKVNPAAKEAMDCYWDLFGLSGTKLYDSRVLYSANFELGSQSIAAWTKQTGGTGLIAADSSKANSGAWSLHVSFAGVSSYARATTPAISPWDTTKDYKITLHYYVPVCTSNTRVIVIDDGRLRLSNLLMTYPLPNGPATSILVVEDSTSYYDIAPLTVGQWHTIEVARHGTTCQVWVDGYTPGYWDPLYNPSGTGTTLSMGGLAPEGRATGDAYWDDISVFGQ